MVFVLLEGYTGFVYLSALFGILMTFGFIVPFCTKALQVFCFYNLQNIYSTII
jgi:hypothetical protein